jgi:hypothetical protein
MQTRRIAFAPVLVAIIALAPAGARAGSVFGSVERGAVRGLFGSVERGAARSVERGTARSVERSATRSVERGTGRSLERGAARSVERDAFRSIDRKAMRSLERGRLRNITRLDLLNHERARVAPITNPRAVFRFTTRDKALNELRQGIAPNHHMTAYAGPGRPLSADSAMRRFGLPIKPQVRETIIIPSRQPIRLNKVVGGAAGVGEVTSTRRLPPEVIRRLVPLH